MNSGRLGGAYQGAVEATGALVISVLLGAWGDSKLDSSPTFLFIGLAVGFGAFILRLTRLLREVSASEDDTADTANTADEANGAGEADTTPTRDKDDGPGAGPA
jgi:F0F1-type ATP synthase assembly protein I